MGMSPDQIAAAANYFGTKNAARTATVRQLGNAPLLTGVGAAVKASKGSSVPTSIKGVPSSIVPAGNASNSLESTVKSIVGGVPILGSLLTGDLPGGGGSIVHQALADQGKNQSPQNLTQGILNFLSTGAYASGRFLNEIGHNVADANVKSAANPGYVGSGQYFGDLAHGVVSPLAAAARGIAEGFGARFDGQKPITPGADLKNIGATGAFGDAVKGAVGGISGDNAAGKQAGDFAAGTLGFLGDVALDPATYLGGTGIVKGLVRGAQDASIAARTGSGVADILKTAAQGTVKGVKDARAELAATKALKAEAKAASADAPVVDLATQRAADAAARGEAPIHPDIATMPESEISKLITPEGAPKAAGAKIPNEEALTARNAAVQNLLPDLKTAGIDTSKLLADASVAHPLGIGQDTAAAVRNVLSVAEPKAVTPAIDAIKATPEGAAFLGRTVKVAGQSTTIEKLLSDAATNHAVARFTDGTPSAKGLLNAKAVNQAVDIAVQAAGKTGITADSLAGAATSAGLGDTPNLGGIIQQALAAAPGIPREAILKQAFGGGTGFSNFSDAMKAAANGQVESSMMRSMLKALGVDTQAKTSNGLQKALNTRGAMNWDAIQNAIPTAQEVLDSHGIDAATSAAAKTVDVSQAAKDAAVAYEKGAREVAGTDPTVLEPHDTSTVHGLVGAMINHGVKAVTDLSTKTRGVFSELYNNEAWLAVHRALMSTIRHAANGNALEGAARQDFMYARYGEAIREVENHQRSLSQYPQLQYGAGEQPLYVSFGQIYHALPQDVIAPAMFNVNHELGFGLGNPVFKEGLAVYPTTIGNGVRAAINGADTAAIRAAMKNAGPVGLNTFERSAAGQRALDNLALAISDPGFVTAMKATHDAQQILAVGKANLDAAAAVIPLRDAVIAAAERTTGDRADMTTAVMEAQKNVKYMAPAEAESLTRDIASQEVQNGIAGSIQDAGIAQTRADTRALKAARGEQTPAETFSLFEQTKAAYKRARTKTGQQITPTTPVRTSASDKVLQNATAQGNVAWSEDMAPSIQATADQAVRDGFYEDTELGNIAASVDAEIQSPIARIFSKVGRSFDGSYGQYNIADIRVEAVTAAKQAMGVYESKLRGLLFGTTIRPPGFFGKAEHVEGIGDRLGQELGLNRPANVQEMNSFFTKAWSAISVHQAAAGRQLSDPELAAALQEGASGIGNKAVGGATPFSDAETEMALEFNALRSEVFHHSGILLRAGVSTKDLMNELARYGMGHGGELGDYMPPAMNVADLATVDQAYDFGLMEHPLDVLNAWYKGLAASSVRPSIGSALSHLADHRAQWPTASIAELKAAKWTKIDTAADGGLAPYIDPESYFPPELIPQMRQMNRFLNDMEKPLPPLLSKIFSMADPITNVWKQGVTSINPRHHVSNTLGDLGMNALAGVNPLYAVKATRVMHDLGQIGQADLKPLDDALAQVGEAGSTVKSTFGNSVVTVTIGREGGSFTKVQLTPQQYWEMGHNAGAFQNAHDALDIVSQVAKKSRLETAPNVGSQANRFLGDLSAARDNLPRLAHFMHILESRPFGSIDEAIRMATADVNKWHPTIASLSPFEQKYVRRALMFYSWSRQALGAVLTTSLEHPAYITLPSKFQYEQAQAAGFQPDSFGKPIGPDPRIPSYEQNGVYGPTFQAGLTPFSDPASTADGISHLWGLSLSTPQLDAMTSFFGGVNMDRKQGPIQGFLQGLSAQLNPLVRAPIEYISDTPLSGIGKAPSANYGNWLLNSSGIGGTIGNLAGITNAKPLNTPTENQAVQVRAFVNWLSGLKFTDYTSATAAAVAHTEQATDDTKRLRDAGYSDAQIRTIKALWKAQQTAATNAGK